jgi:LAO/AO transport system kinase
MRTSDKALAKFITAIENNAPGYLNQLAQMSFKPTPVVGITGPPGAGKSTLVNALITELLKENKKIGVIAVDPSSPFNHGAIMGDRLRMGDHFLNSNVFIRSMASRGNLGGLAPKIFEVCDAMRAADFDYIFIETVGVGQSEVEIAALADTTVLVLVPEAGDDIQAIKSGVMEIADVFVVNKSDREGADTLYKNLVTLAHTNATENWECPVIKCIATQQVGIDSLVNAIQKHHSVPANNQKKVQLLAQKAMAIIKAMRTADLSEQKIAEDLLVQPNLQNFNLYSYVMKYIE